MRFYSALLLVCLNLFVDGKSHKHKVVLKSQSNAPEQVHLSYHGQPTEITVQWITQKKFDSKSTYAYVLYTDFKTKWRVNATTEKWTDGGKNSVTRYTHTATMTGLEPGKTFYYNVGSDEAMSKSYEFKALPQDGKLRAAIFGDFSENADVSAWFNYPSLRYAVARQSASMSTYYKSAGQNVYRPSQIRKTIHPIPPPSPDVFEPIDEDFKFAKSLGVEYQLVLEGLPEAAIDPRLTPDKRRAADRYLLNNILACYGLDARIVLSYRMGCYSLSHPRPLKLFFGSSHGSSNFLASFHRLPKSLLPWYARHITIRRSDPSRFRHKQTGPNPTISTAQKCVSTESIIPKLMDIDVTPHHNTSLITMIERKGAATQTDDLPASAPIALSFKKPIHTNAPRKRGRPLTSSKDSSLNPLKNGSPPKTKPRRTLSLNCLATSPSSTSTFRADTEYESDCTYKSLSQPTNSINDLSQQLSISQESTTNQSIVPQS